MDQQQETLRNDTDPAVKRRALLRIQQALIAAQEIGDEKLQIVQQVQDLIENKSRQLDVDYRNLGIISRTFLKLLQIIKTRVNLTCYCIIFIILYNLVCNFIT